MPSPTVEENQVESAPPLPVDHGPILVYGPSPEIPASLQTQEINTSVGIQFLIDSSGRVQAQLTTSSGNEELDAIALETLKKWVFRPAQKDGKPIDSKIKSQIHFLVN
ncbi:MAG: energy transducer TonB [Bdellovibrionia bacterium]